MKTCIVIFLLIAISILSHAQNLTLNQSSFRKGTLKNGLSYYILNNSAPGTEVEMRLVIKAGYPLETPDQLGLAHLIEHISFRATRNFPNGLREFLKAKGLQVGGSTGDGTIYRVKIPASNSVSLGYGLLALHDFADGQLFLPEEIEQERSAVGVELSSGDTPVSRGLMNAKYQFFDSMKIYQPYVDREMRNVETAPLESMMRFYDDWYKAEHMGVIIVGNVNVGELEEQVRKQFENLKRGTKKIDKKEVYKKYKVPLADKNRVLFTDGQKEIIEINFLKKKKSSEIKQGQNLKTQLLDDLFSEIMDHRLKVLVRNGEISASQRSLQIRPYRGVFDQRAGVDAIHGIVTVRNFQQVKDAIQSLAKELHRLEQYGFSEEELIRGKEKVMPQIAERVTSDLSKLMGVFVDNDTPQLQTNETSIKQQLLTNINLKELNQMVQPWLRSLGNMDILIKSSWSNHSLPTEQEVWAWVQEAKNTPVTRFVLPKIKKLPELVVHTDSMYKVSYNSKLSITELRLTNGARVILKPMIRNEALKSDAIMIRGFKNYTETVQDEAAFENVGNFMSVGSLTKKELTEWIEERNQGGSLYVGSRIGKGYAEIEGSGSLNRLNDLFSLMHLYLTEPTVDERAFNGWDVKRKRMLTVQHPTLEDSIRSVINNSLKQELTGTARPDDIAKAYKKLFGNLDSFTIVVTGDFKTDELIPLVAKYFGSVSSSVSGLKAKPVTSIQKNDLKVLMVGDSVGNTGVTVLFPLASVYDEMNSVKLNILSKAIENLLFQRLREKERGVYSVTANVVISEELVPAYFLRINFESAPKDVDRLIKATLEEISSVLEHGLSEDLFNGSRAFVRQRLSGQLNHYASLNSFIINQLKYGITLYSDSELLTLLDNLSYKDVWNIARQSIDVNRYSVFKLL